MYKEWVKSNENERKSPTVKSWLDGSSFFFSLTQDLATQKNETWFIFLYKCVVSRYMYI